jgi:hypothetical protein
LFLADSTVLLGACVRALWLGFEHVSVYVIVDFRLELYVCCSGPVLLAILLKRELHDLTRGEGVYNFSAERGVSASTWKEPFRTFIEVTVRREDKSFLRHKNKMD